MKEFKVFGGQDPGLKMQDLMDNKIILEQAGFEVPGALIMATEMSDELYEENGFNEHTSDADFIKMVRPTVGIQEINEQMIEELPVGVPIIARSSGRAERGGTGIFKSCSFILTGNRADDLDRFWKVEKKVFASEFSDEAKEWREVQAVPWGMAIGLQVGVCGKIMERYDNNKFVFAPILAGDAYTEYYSEPLVNVAVGFGKAVMEQDESKDFHYAPSKFAFGLLLSVQDKFFVIQVNGYGDFSCYGKGILKVPYLPTRNFNKIFQRMEKLSKHGNFHLEWAIADGKSPISVVQCAKVEKFSFGPAELIDIGFNKRGTLLAKSNDIVNHGRKICQGIIFAGWQNWTPQCLAWLSKLNHEFKNYLLIVPQNAFSFLASVHLFLSGESGRIDYSHFSRSGAILEQQQAQTEEEKEIDRLKNKLGISTLTVDHTKSMFGGQHFKELCQRGDILFQGTQFDQTKLLDLPGATDYGDNIKVWDIKVEVINDITKGQGEIYLIGRPKVNIFTLTQMEDFADTLRDAANWLNNKGDDLAEDFYTASYASIPWRDNPEGFNCFTINPEEIKKFGGSNLFRQSLSNVISQGENYLEPDSWTNIKNWLEEVLKSV